MEIISANTSDTAVRLGMVGIAFANRDGTVTEANGALSNWLQEGQRIAESASALLGMDEALDELCENPGQQLTLPNICLDQFQQDNFHTIKVQWDAETEQFVISTTLMEATRGSELDDLRTLRAEQYLQERLQEERQHFRTLYEHSPHLAICYNNKARMLAGSNDLKNQFFGDQPEESALHQQLTTGLIWAAMWSGERLHRHLIKVNNNNGELRQLELSGYLVTPPGMLSEEVFYSLVDVTERQESRLQMQERSGEQEAITQQLQEANSRLSRFASVAAHDLLSPLRRIATFSQIVGEEFQGPQSDSLKFALRAIQRSAERGQTLVDDVMHLTQTANSKSRLVALNPSELLKLVAKDSGLSSEQVNGHLQYVGESHLVMGDAKLLRTIYRNLLSNAIKYRNHSRSLVITHTVTDTGTGHSRIEFTDNGIGFDPELASQVFEPFKRLVGDDHPVAGTGLGLSIVQEASSAMNCRVTASSKPGVGTTIALMTRSAPA